MRESVIVWVSSPGESISDRLWPSARMRRPRLMLIYNLDAQQKQKCRNHATRTFFVDQGEGKSNKEKGVTVFMMVLVVRQGHKEAGEYVGRG